MEDGRDQDREGDERGLEFARVVNLSDAIFAIAATVIVVAIDVPHPPDPTRPASSPASYGSGCRRS